MTDFWDIINNLLAYCFLRVILEVYSVENDKSLNHKHHLDF